MWTLMELELGYLSQIEEGIASIITPHIGTAITPQARVDIEWALTHLLHRYLPRARFTVQFSHNRESRVTSIDLVATNDAAQQLVGKFNMTIGE